MEHVWSSHLYKILYIYHLYNLLLHICESSKVYVSV